MHLLFLSSLLPDGAPSTGFELANQAILDGYRRAGVRLTIAGFRREGARPATADEIDLGTIVIENAAASRLQKARWVFGAIRSGRTVSAEKLARHSRAALLDRLATAGPVDGVILNSVQMPIAYPFLASEMPAIFIAHNVEHRSATENARHGETRLERLLFRREAQILKGEEARLCRSAAVIHTLSEDDRAGLGLSADPRAIPLALSIDRPRHAIDDGARRHDVGLIGTWSWAPNRVGLDWFLAAVAPRLPSDIEIAIAGRMDGAPPEAPKNVHFLGRVPDAQLFVRGARVLALATKGGTGVQLKTIETFEEGLPAVATPAALRGIGAVPANVRVTEDPDAFAAAIAELVAAERAGAPLRLDGSLFAAAQKAALDAGIRQGLALFEAALRKSPVARRTEAEAGPIAPPSADKVQC
ncbi:glycosyltransferase family 4 protein [Jiella sp. MQZ9-1]|uniref:Glycosyltransferase family 4 protein n=1 Tax=Jiella flava TaxID=2816857 RepID=A0A939FY15_9HYPH|nr:glycosyltransferase family 4 protein [Jiella flava]MBO0661637.1 glycosyltransferase family 4 protein [Jiella flava]MCD2470279.1 glycosyltransferase family 4 protein [Jiella flava]